MIFSTGVLCHPEFHWSCLFLPVGTNSESRNRTTEGTLQEPGSTGIREQNEDADSVASDADEEHVLGLNSQSFSEASAHARFCLFFFGTTHFHTSSYFNQNIYTSFKIKITFTNLANAW